MPLLQAAIEGMPASLLLGQVTPAQLHRIVHRIVRRIVIYDHLCRSVPYFIFSLKEVGSGIISRCNNPYRDMLPFFADKLITLAIVFESLEAAAA